MVSRYPGEDAVLGSREVENCAQHRLSSCKGISPFPSSSDATICFEGTNRTFLHTLGEARLLRMWPNLPVRSGGVRMKLRGSDLLQSEVNDLLEHFF